MRYCVTDVIEMIYSKQGGIFFFLVGKVHCIHVKINSFYFTTIVVAIIGLVD